MSFWPPTHCPPVSASWYQVWTLTPGCCSGCYLVWFEPESAYVTQTDPNSLWSPGLLRLPASHPKCWFTDLYIMSIPGIWVCLSACCLPQFSDCLWNWIIFNYFIGYSYCLHGLFKTAEHPKETDGLFMFLRTRWEVGKGKRGWVVGDGKRNNVDLGKRISSVDRI